jgi:hypothetical protein
MPASPIGLEKATDRVKPVVLTTRHNVRTTRIPRYDPGCPIVGENGDATPQRAKLARSGLAQGADPVPMRMISLGTQSSFAGFTVATGPWVSRLTSGSAWR